MNVATSTCMVVSPCGMDRAEAMASFWMQNHASKDRLVLKHQEDNDVDLMCVQPHFYRVWQVGPCHLLGEVVRRFSGAIELLAVCLNKNKNYPPGKGCKGVPSGC